MIVASIMEKKQEKNLYLMHVLAYFIGFFFGNNLYLHSLMKQKNMHYIVYITISI